jgi:hypothetical protein
MKTRQIVVVGITVMLLTAIGILAGCSNPSGDDSPPPVEIGTLADLDAISASAEGMSGNYKLTADITGVTAPIGDVSGGISTMLFTGDFDGNGHTVTLNITSGINVSGSGETDGIYAGLFAAVGG